MPAFIGMQDFIIGAISGAAIGFALFHSRWFFELAIGMVAAAVLCGLVIDGVEGYLGWVRFALASLPRFSGFLVALGGGLAGGAGLGLVTRRRTAP